MSLLVLVLMPFAKNLNARYEVAIKSAVCDAGMRAERVDKQSFHRQGITEKIIQQIQDADIIVADMSTNNPNVFYEVGYAHAKDKLCILLTDDPRKIPFDLTNKRHVVFSTRKDLKTKLLMELEALKVELELLFDKADPECVATVAVGTVQVTGNSQATSIRAKVKTGGEVHVKKCICADDRNPTAYWSPPMEAIQANTANPINVDRH
jgi:nucleoside 2-deoxyribosyltransferase